MGKLGKFKRSLTEKQLDGVRMNIHVSFYHNKYQWKFNKSAYKIAKSIAKVAHSDTNTK